MQCCPNMPTFGGLGVGHVSQQLTFGRWSSRLRRIFYADCLARGGQLELRPWSGRRWFKRQERRPQDRLIGVFVIFTKFVILAKFGYKLSTIAYK